jgi:glycosyltransferase involved in cell wall biosynthesis
MIDDFRRRYSSKCRFDFVYPSVVSLPLGQPRRQMPEVFRLGLLANLTVAKGLDLVLDTFHALRERGCNVRLTLAGPCGTVEAERLIRAALQQHPDCLEHIGPVYGEHKEQFFHSIDCFLFPSQTESWGIVLNEALAAGVPVIATNRGCIRTLVGDRAGLVIDDAKAYVDTATRQVESWMDSPPGYFAASQAAIEQADCLHREAAIQLDRVAHRICSLENANYCL